jgi:hypothetical protein
MPNTLEKEARLRILVSTLILIGIVTCAVALQLGAGHRHLAG